ncbi:MAG: diguanylate cyclase domain-containing protein [Oceanisphaera sp.]|uniref:diguanylate cyclase domain-containing protein n=1 Tax=Oceanisphaera sp. TaxID=1929979 RepID=UPI003F9C627F
MFQKRLSSIYPFIIFILVLAAGYYYTHLSITAQRNEQRLLLTEVISAQVAAIERHLSHSLSTTYILAHEVRRSQGQLNDFEAFAEGILQTLGGVASLQLAPRGIIERIYPLVGNEEAIGHHLLNSDNRKKEALESINSGLLTLSGPFMLRQGKVGIIGRKPIFLERKGAPAFWGFAMAVIYLDELLSLTELDKLQAKGYAYQLSRTHPDTLQEDIFTRSNHNLHQLIVNKDIRIPNGEWHMAISQQTHFPSQWLVGILLSLLAASLFSFIARRMLLEPDRLRALVDKQTLQLAQLAFNDELTGLANRRSITEQLNTAIRYTERDNTCLALLYLDLDNFKCVNDTVGHEGGDHLLIEIAQRLQNTVRASDIVGRLGGDEFAIILTHIEDQESVRLIAEKIIEQVCIPVQLKQYQAKVGASIGISISPTDGNSGEALVRNADLAMYHSKWSGKNQFSFFSDDMRG